MAEILCFCLVFYLYLQSHFDLVYLFILNACFVVS